MELGTKIKQLRKSRNLKQDDLAFVLDLSRGQISNLENNRRSLSLDQLNAICNYFKIDISYFGITNHYEESTTILEKVKLLFNSDIPVEKKDILYQNIMKVYLESKEVSHWKQSL